MKSPLVSVIITTYAGSKVISRAVESVCKQTYSNWELIIVDDNNPETEERKRTQEVVQKYISDKIRYIKHIKNKNGSAARNTGIKNAKGIYIAFLDDDDVFYPERIERCVRELEDNPQYDSVLTNVIVTDGSEIVDIIEQSSHKDPLRDMFFGNPLGTGSNLFLTKKSIEALGGFDESFLRRQDVEFMVRFYKSFKSAYIQDSLVVKIVESREKVNIDYKKFRKIEEHFIATFRDTIFGYLSEKDRNNYLNHTYTVLFRMALVSSSEDLKEAVKDLLSVRPLSEKEKIMVKTEKLYRACRNNKILYAIKKRKERERYRKQVNTLISRVSDSQREMLFTLGALK